MQAQKYSVNQHHISETVDVEIKNGPASEETSPANGKTLFLLNHQFGVGGSFSVLYDDGVNARREIRYGQQQLLRIFDIHTCMRYCEAA